MFNTPYTVPYKSRESSPYKTLEEALVLVKQAIRGEKEDELFYDYLISIAPTGEEKDIIAGIRDDERKHNKMFKEIYKFYTGEEIKVPADTQFEKPKSYISGIKKAFFGELSAAERYRDIYAGLTKRYYKDMSFEILTDELEHADKYNYILNINIGKMVQNRKANINPTIPPKAGFTTEEAVKIAKELGIDFSKEKFDIEQFRKGLDVELEHGRRDSDTNVTGDDPIATGKIALAHLREFPDYYTRLSKLEEEAKAFWGRHKHQHC